MLNGFAVRQLLFLLASVVLILFWAFHNRALNHRFNDYSCPGFYTPPITHTGAAKPVEAQLQDRNATLPDFEQTSYAYVFYATEEDYACSILVNIDRLHAHFNNTHRIIVIVKPSLDAEYLNAFTSRNATVIPYEPPELKVDFPYYNDVLLKLVSFRLHQYIPSLKRIVVLDADQLILKSLDTLFSLPEVDVAAPRVHWAKDPSQLTSALMVISLSNRVWNEVQSAIDKLEGNQFDMEIINDLFRSSALVLPGDYCTLNTVWETSEVPSWWQGRVPPRDPDWRPITPLLLPHGPKEAALTNNEKPQATNDAGLSVVKRENGSSQQPFEEDNVQVPVLELTPEESEKHKEALWKEEMRERAPRVKETLDKVYQEVKVLHYTAYGKPWMSPVLAVQEKRPDAHYLLAEQMKVWRVKAKEVCPSFENITI